MKDSDVVVLVIWRCLENLFRKIAYFWNFAGCRNWYSVAFLKLWTFVFIGDYIYSKDWDVIILVIWRSLENLFSKIAYFWNGSRKWYTVAFLKLCTFIFVGEYIYSKDCDVVILVIATCLENLFSKIAYFWSHAVCRNLYCCRLETLNPYLCKRLDI